MATDMLRNPRGRVCTLYNVDTATNTESRYRYREYFYWINIQALSRRSSIQRVFLLESWVLPLPLACEGQVPLAAQLPR